MIKRLSVVSFLLLATLASGLPLQADDAQQDGAAMIRALEMLREGDRLADGEDYNAALLRYNEAYQRIVPVIRGLEMKKPVEPRLMARAELQEYMTQELVEEMTEDELRFFDRSLKAFGFAPSELDAKTTMLQILGEEVAGFYNPETDEMVLIKEEPAQKRGLFDVLFGSSEFDKDEQKITLAHEMAHALADQHFDLDAMDEASKHDDDMMLAISALVEGEATVVMLGELLREEGDEQQVLTMEPSRAEWMFRLTSWTIPFVGGKTVRQAPPIFRKTLLFPYHKGTVLVLHLTNRDGWEAVNRAFRDPPLSTEQVLHPEKFFGDRDVPVEIELPELGEIVGADWKHLGENVLGEFQLQVLLEDHWDGVAAAAGWDGDSYAVYEKEDGQLGLAWATTWDDESEAAQFARTYAQHRAARLRGKSAAEEARESSPPPARPELSEGDHQRWRWLQEGREYVVERRAADVVVIEGFAPESGEKLRNALFAAEKRPKKLRVPEAQQPEDPPADE